MSLTTREGAALAAAALGLAALAAGGWLLLAPVLGTPSTPVGQAFESRTDFLPASDAADATPGDELVIDVQGGVVSPGLVVLAGGARVADAIAAAGGYAPTADLLAASASLNLAAPLSDGQQVFVPLAGVARGPTGGGGDGGGGGPVNLNTASPEALEALPGIGPVTVQKIVAARAERPFSSLDELVERKVLNRGQLDGIRDLVTV
jgi:competence protein ComEA